MKKKTLAKGITGLALAALLVQPLALNGSAKQTDPVELKIYSEKAPSIQKTLDAFSKDETLKKVKAQLDRGALRAEKIGLSNKGEGQELAADVRTVREDKNLQKQLANRLKSGAKVYLYGGVTIDEYKDLMEISEVSVKVKDEKAKDLNLTFGGEKEKAEKEGKKLKQNPYSLAAEDENSYDIVGYSIVEANENKFAVTNISVFDDAGNEIEPTEEYYIREILEISADTAAKIEVQTFSLGSIFGLNRVHADSEPVTSSPTRITATAYYNGVIAGRTYTDWVLEKAGDSDSSFDYFLVNDKTTISGANGFVAKYLKSDHDIPYDSDYIIDWDPDDDTSSPYNLSFGVPFSAAWSFDMSNSPKVNNIGSQPYDYGRWEVTPGGLSSSINGVRFEPATTWKSAGTYASMDIREYGTFRNAKNIAAYSSVKIDVNYDYN
ncbi:hypothetical protein DFO70_11786 [Cytobacillus firmus]|uniref:Uncharacterized protein n=2 Tax=Cytobacillus TaxID=2675230 RepID=A0A366JKC8_CYTFI|nr:MULTISPECIES: hypothetical protein [Cytobacillus]RBP87895.1 hypothetical protein DFO70_11786 [Cytobacillus firmus]TDX39258.1 hypothetical protein DFO72_11188 [Cytobacillus oceanisediminis]